MTMALEDIFNFLQLSESLATAGQPSESQVAEIARQGFQVIINLGLTKTEYALEDEANLVKSLGMTYIHIPVLWDHPTRDDLETFFAVMDVYQSAIDNHQHKCVFVHCAANMRVSVFIALYRALRLGWSWERAFQDVQRIWTPNEIWGEFIDEILGRS